MEENRIFPDNWKEVVRGKKVILYNTGVSSLLGGREKRIEKMKWVFQTFREHPEVVLWWRPHPLELSTLQSMLPELEEQYMAVKQQYIEENIGVLDESADLNRAIAISDAYYGAWSSVAELYKAAGTPVLFENQSLYEWHKDLFFDVTDFVLLDRNVWFLSSTMNILFVMNLDTFELVEIIKIPYGNALEKYLSYRLAVVGEYLVLIPGCGKYIIRLSLNERMFDKLEIGEYGVSMKFGAYAIFDGYIYMLPTFENRLIKYDVIQNKVVYEKKLREKKKPLFLELNMDVNGQYIYAVEGGKNHIYKYDMQNDTCEKIQVPGENVQLCGIKKINNLYLLILANKAELLLWDEKENRTCKLDGVPQGYPVKDRSFCDSVVYKEDVYFFPEQSDKIYKLNIEQMTLEQYLEIDERKEGEKGTNFTRAKNIGNEILAFSHWNNQWVIINPEECKVRKRNTIVRDEIRGIIAGYSTVDEEGDYDKKERIYEEDQDFYSLHNYIRDVNRINLAKQNIGKEKSVGEVIHQEIIEVFL